MKHIVCLFLLLQVSASLLAQSTSHVQAYIRVGAGASRAIGGQPSSEGYVVIPGSYPFLLGGSQRVLGGNVGAGITVSIGQHFTIQTEINVEQKGSKEKLVRTTSGLDCDLGPCTVSYPINGNFTSRLTYITMPIMAGYGVGKFTLLVGPYVGYKVGERLSGTYSFPSRTDVYSIDASTRGYKDLDAGFVVGVTCAISPCFGIDLRYNQGLRYAVEPYDGYHDRFYNQSAQVGVTYALTHN